MLLGAAHARFSLAPHLSGSRWHAGFAHAAAYGAGYYTYLYAAALSAALWQRLFARDPFDRAAGERLRRELLARGAGACPVEMTEALLGGKATIVPLLRELGIAVDGDAAAAEAAEGAAGGGGAAAAAVAVAEPPAQVRANESGRAAAA